MANYFDQFDAPPQATPPQKNYFDQFDAPLQPQGQAQAGMTPSGINWTDIAKSGGTGLREGVEGAMTMAGYLDPVNYANAIRTGTLPANYGQQFNKSLESKVGNLNYTPQTTLGHYAHAIGQFAPFAIGGPEGLAAKAADVVIPAIASESLGEYTKGTPFEEPARAVGALFGPRIIGAGANAIPALGRTLGVAPNAVAPAALSAEELFNQSGQAFDKAFQGGKGPTLPQADALNAGQQIEQSLTDAGFNRSVAPNTGAALDHIQNQAQAGQLTLKDLHYARQMANNARRAGGNDAYFGGQLIDHIDDLMGTVPGGADVSNAIALNRTARKTQIVEDQMNNAQLDANAGSGDYQKNLSKRFLALSKNQRLMRNFNDDETNAIQNVAGGGLIHNVAGWIGDKLSSPLGQIAGAVGGGAIGLTQGEPVSGAIGGYLGAKNFGETLKRMGTGAQGRAEAVHAIVSGAGNPAAQAQYQAARNLRLANMLQRYGPPLLAGASTIQEPQ